MCVCVCVCVCLVSVVSIGEIPLVYGSLSPPHLCQYPPYSISPHISAINTPIRIILNRLSTTLLVYYYYTCTCIEGCEMSDLENWFQ